MYISQVHISYKLPKLLYQAEVFNVLIGITAQFDFVVACSPCFVLLDEVINELLSWLRVLVAFGE